MGALLDDDDGEYNVVINIIYHNIVFAMLLVACVREQKPKFLYLCCTDQPTFYDDEFYRLQPSKMLSQINSIVTLSRDRQCQHPLSCHPAEATRSFLPCKEEDKLFHPCKISKSGRDTTDAGTAQCTSLPSSFCHLCPYSSTFQKYFLGTPVTA